jgi:hypothetical protein
MAGYNKELAMLKHLVITAATTAAITTFTVLPTAFTVLPTAQAQRSSRDISTVKMCTGLKGLNYYWVGEQIQAQAKNQVNIVLVTSKGSLENIDRLNSGECDVALIQSDTTIAANNAGGIEVGEPLYKEYWHLICNTDANVDRVTKLNQKTPILLGDNGSGVETTWTAFVKADPDRYGKVPHEPKGGQRAAGLVKKGDEAACMAVVTGLNSEGIQTVNNIAKTSDNMRLIPSDDGDILKLKDSKGRLVYTRETIPSKTYDGLQKGWFSSAVNTIGVQAVIAANKDFLDKDQAAYSKFLDAVHKALPTIKAKLEPG